MVFNTPSIFHWIVAVTWPGRGRQCCPMCQGGKGTEFDEHVAVSVIIFLVMMTYSLKKITQFCATIWINYVDNPY